MTEIMPVPGNCDTTDHNLAVLLRSVVPLRLVIQHGSGGGVDDVVILHAAGLELHLIHGPAVFVVPFRLQLPDLALGQTCVLQGRGLGGLGADVGAAGAAAKVLLLIVQHAAGGGVHSDLIGGAVGLLLAAGLVIVFTVLLKGGVPSLGATLIPLFIFVAMLVLLNPYLPMFFNNVGFCYFIIALIDAETAVANLPKYLFSLLLGSVILNLGCSGLLALYTKAVSKKVMQNRQKENAK